MNRIVEELKHMGVFFVGTIDGDQPRVRPFSSVTDFEGQLYICTNNTKDVYKQMMANPRIEISACKEGAWLRIVGTVVRDDRDEARKAMLEDPTGPSNLYTLGDGIFEVLRVENPVCTKYSFTEAPKIIEP